ncbi:hypothetical protein BJX99DRAFT_162989 [Aspergillus californicus]
MASNREERLQMRQRGAGTRKIKEVDFGFSLGFGPVDESSQPAQPLDTGLPAPELEPAPQPPTLDAPLHEITTTEVSQTQSFTSPTRVNSSQEQSQRTLGSARNKLPPRPSTFDIPTDENLEQERSNKRRKLDSPTPVSALIDAQVEPQEPDTTNGTAGSTEQLPKEGVAIPIRTSITSNPDQIRDQEPITDVPQIPIPEPEDIPRTLNEVERLLASAAERANPMVLDPPRTNGTSPASDTSKGRGGKSRSPRQSEVAIAEPVEEVQPTEPPAAESPAPEHSAPEIPQEPEPPQAQDKRIRSRTPASVQLDPPIEKATEYASSEQASGDTKGKRGRKRKNLEPAEKSPKEPNEPSPAQLGESNDAATHESADPSEDQDQPNGADKGKKRAGRPRKATSQTAEPTETARPSKTKPAEGEQSQEQPEAEPEPQVTSRGRKRRGRVPEPEEQQPEPEEPELESESASSHRGRKKRGPQVTEEQPEAEPEVQSSRPGRKKKQAEPQVADEQVSEAEPEVESSRQGKKKKRDQPQVAEQEESEPEPEAQARPGRRKKRDLQVAEEPEERAPEPEVETREGRKKQRTVQPAEESEQIPEVEPRPGKRKRQREQEQEQPEPEPETEHEQPQPQVKRRGRPSMQQGERPTATRDGAETERPRKPRQPRGETVPVTVHRLANAASLGAPEHESSEDEAGPNDSNTQTNKLPARGGVNAADVLAQICRETLEKTLTTLKNGIANEANTGKRAEWTLRRKAVEAFGAELEGRLFELSEVLDSNFMLSAKLKKAKRNMMDRRNRLDQLRKEREAVALRMDAVRREHAKEEQAGKARSTINRSLHNLDLALERGQTGTDEQLTAGLEFRLRSVAQAVSSTASGSQGGLLNQIKMFNAELEAAARDLEG